MAAGGPLRPWLELIRLPAVFTAPADVIAGAAIAGALAPTPINPLDHPGPLGLLIAASVCIYIAGMAANDVCDAGVDAVERPGRPIPSGRVSLAGAWALILILQVAGIGLAWLVGPPAALATAATVGFTWLYNGAVKASIIGPVAMGLCRYGNAAIGLTLLGWPVGHLAWLVPLTTLAYVAALTTLSRFEVDGATSGQVAGPAAAMFLLAAAPAVWALSGVLPDVFGAGLAALPLLWLAGPLKRAWKAPGAGPVRGGVMAGIFGIAMINGALAAATGHWILAAVIIGLLVPGKAVGRWFYAT